MTLRIVAILLLSSLLLTSCGKPPEKRLAPPAIKVGASTVEKGEIKQTLDVSGNVQFIANTTVSSQVAAQVKTIHVRDGQIVKKGQTLVTFDDSTIRATADQARGTLQKDQASLAYNKAEWEKNVSLLQSGAISQSTYDQKYSAYQNSVGQVEADKGALAKALEDLKHTEEVAPIDGVLSSRFIETGDWVASGARLFEISDYSTVYLQTFLSDKDVGKLDIDKVTHEGKGVDAEVTVDSRPGRTFMGTIGYIQPVANTNRLFEVRLYIPNSDMQLLQGMYARARILVHRQTNVTRIPTDALIDQLRVNDANTVVRVDPDSKAEIVRIKVGAIDRTHAEILDGLKPGDKVVVAGKDVLSNGQPVEITSSTPALADASGKRQ
jgi:membrane fusion protein (multidrug efflux system)